MASGKRFEVSGTDDLGDLHIFATDDQERADEIRAIMGEDLAEVTITDKDALT